MSLFGGGRVNTLKILQFENVGCVSPSSYGGTAPAGEFPAVARNFNHAKQ